MSSANNSTWYWVPGENIWMSYATNERSIFLPVDSAIVAETDWDKFVAYLQSIQNDPDKWKMYQFEINDLYAWTQQGTTPQFAVIPITGISYWTSVTSIAVGSTITNTTTSVIPSVAMHGAITYTSSDDTVATVDSNGHVTGVKAGTATITASISGFSASRTITVTAAS